MYPSKRRCIQVVPGVTQLYYSKDKIIFIEFVGYSIIILKEHVVYSMCTSWDRIFS